MNIQKRPLQIFDKKNPCKRLSDTEFFYSAKETNKNSIFFQADEAK